MELKEISKDYGKKQVLDKINLSIKPGRILALIGNNGSGKTTTFRILAGLIKPDSGTIETNYKEKVSFLTEEKGFYEENTVLEQLLFIGGLNGLKGKQNRSKAKELIDELKLESYTNLKIKKLSKGNRQKVKLAGALMNEPDLLILDEPYTGLDFENVQLLSQYVRKLALKKTAVILSSHRYELVKETADDFAYLALGRIKCQISKEELMSRQERVIRVKDEVELDSEKIIYEYREGNQYRYIFDCEASANEVVNKLAIDYSYEYLSIEDYIRGKLYE